MGWLFGREKLSATALAEAERSLAQLRMERKEAALAQRRIREHVRLNRAAQAECARQLKTRVFKGKSTKELRRLTSDLAALEQQRQRVVAKVLALDEAILRRFA